MSLFENMNLQKTVLVIAIFAFIFAVFIITYKLQNAENDKWSPVVAKCPDYWEINGSYCVNNNGMNKGSLKYASVDESNLYESKIPACHSSTCVIPIDATKNNSKKWANSNGFVWDGLT